jgi:hypothetical protein
VEQAAHLCSTRPTATTSGSVGESARSPSP